MKRRSQTFFAARAPLLQSPEAWFVSHCTSGALAANVFWSITL